MKSLLPPTADHLLFAGVKTVLFFIFVVLLVRLSGKRTTSQMNNFDWFITVTAGSVMASGILLPNVSLVTAAAAFVVLIACQWLTTQLAIHSALFRRLVKATPRVLVRDGAYCQEAMRKERITRAEVDAGLRQNGLVDVSEAGLVILETNGSISVIPRDRLGTNRQGAVSHLRADSAEPTT